MKHFVENCKHRIETYIYNVGHDEKNRLKQIEQIVSYIETTINQLRNFVRTYTFTDRKEEIEFFKVQKPQLYSLLLYYVRLYDMESKRQEKSLFSQGTYLNRELKKVSYLSGQPDSFYQYYRSGKTDRDETYFLRESYNVLNDVSCKAFDSAPAFSTSHDYEVANILANDLLMNYIRLEVEAINSKMHSQVIDLLASDKMQWTGSKVALVELIYALYSSQCINGGNISLKEIALCVETLFRIEVGDFYRIFLEIRGRRKNRTVFLDEMKDRLISIMDNLDK